jgi:hypothetical protein
MNTAELIRKAEAAGVELRLVDGKVKASGDRMAVGEIVAQLRDHKQEIASLLIGAEEMTHRLLAAAMACCDHHHDRVEAREQMRRDCLARPPHLQRDLLDHLESTYGRTE